MNIEPDIIRRIKEDFPVTDATGAIELLVESGVSGRVARCMVFAARGSLANLRKLADVAAKDYRDAIMAGEYDNARRHIRDFCVSFLIDSPGKFWISEFAKMMDHRGYSLISVDPIEDRATAIFDGGAGRLTVAKQNNRWSLYAGAVDAGLHGLAGEYDSERQFTDAVSSYLLTRHNPIRPL
ncbi:MAG TPA: hypothetical protein VG733_09175 [Chthoniobacteraceae bacterium]|nr:hypothetical protein [Chthoniobacteraceae bacterium]